MRAHRRERRENILKIDERVDAEALGQQRNGRGVFGWRKRSSRGNPVAALYLRYPIGAARLPHHPDRGVGGGLAAQGLDKGIVHYCLGHVLPLGWDVRALLAARSPERIKACMRSIAADHVARPRHQGSGVVSGGIGYPLRIQPSNAAPSVRGGGGLRSVEEEMSTRYTWSPMGRAGRES